MRVEGFEQFKHSLYAVFMEKRHTGHTKRFAYPGNNRQKDNQQNEFIFSPRKSDSPRAGGLDMDDVWSIKKNVSLNGSSKPSPGQQTGLEGLNFKANHTYYSRYGGVKVGRDNFDSSSFGGSNSVPRNKEDSSSKGGSWNYMSKGFSYSFGNNTDNSKNEKGPSPTNQSRNGNHNFYESKFNDSSLW